MIDQSTTEVLKYFENVPSPKIFLNHSPNSKFHNLLHLQKPYDHSKVKIIIYLLPLTYKFVLF